MLQPAAEIIDDAFHSGDFARLAYEYAPIGLVITENRVIRDCNATFARMFGYAAADLRNRLFAVLYPSEAEFLNIRNRGVKDLRETNTYWDERVMRRQDGTLFWCRVRGHSFTPDDPLARAVWSFADISANRPYQPLTRREREVFALMGEGRTSKEIALALGLSHRTVEVHRARLLRKFDAANTVELVQTLGALGGPHVVSG